MKYAGNQRLPDVRLNASYQASGLGGTQVLRTGGFPGTIVGPGADHRLRHRCSASCSRNDYPTWAVGVSVSYPIGESADQANYARAQLERSAGGRAAEERARRAPSSRSATPAWKIEMNAKRIETTRAARELAEQRLDAERKRFDVGMSTSFLVIQAQRDLAQAKTNELGAVLAYDLSLVDFEALQQAAARNQGQWFRRFSGHRVCTNDVQLAADGGGLVNAASAGRTAAATLPASSAAVTAPTVSRARVARTQEPHVDRCAAPARRRRDGLRAASSSTTARWS